MPYELITSEHLDKIFHKLAKKDKLQFDILTRKIKEVLEDPKIGEPLKGQMAGQRSVHVRNFCLVYEILENEKIVKLLDYDHHDAVYY
jgi:addiction module RelE/StbE family toxin